MGSDVSKYAGLWWSMETTDALPLMSNIKCLLECLVRTIIRLLQWCFHCIMSNKNMGTGIKILLTYDPFC